MSHAVERAAAVLDEAPSAGRGAERLPPPIARLLAARRRAAFLFGLAAIALAVAGQRALEQAGEVIGPSQVKQSAVWYTLGVAVLLLGWWGSAANRSLVRVPLLGATPWRRGERAIRLGIAALALALNVGGVQLLRHDWSSRGGGALWLLSLVVLLLACIGERISPARERPAPGQAGRGAPWRLPPDIEAGIFGAILVGAALLRLWRLGDLAHGMHGDEGEAGVQALQILGGNLPSPFTAGWSNQANLYYWSIAAAMKLFGAGLAGLRSLAVVFGLLTVVFVYLLTREWFGQRAAAIAGCFAAFQSALLTFSQHEYSNSTTPAFTVAAFYFLARGLRTRRHLDFLVAGLVGGFSLYYFAGGRLIGLVLAASLAYLAVVQRSFLAAYWSRGAALLLGLLAAGAPFLAYFVVDHPITGSTYPNDRFVWLNFPRLAEQYHSQQWPVILWGQATRTLSLLTYRADQSAIRTINYPIAQTLEAALIVLGLAWAVWRWRDTRFALLSAWFWSAVIAGGVLTIDAPNLERIVAILAALPIIIAAVLDHFAALSAGAADGLGQFLPWRRAGQVVGGVAVGAAVLISGVQNWDKYVLSYLNTHQDPEVSLQAAVVRALGADYRFYAMGVPILYWAHGDNRFINPHAAGADLANPANALPLIDNGPRGETSVAFLVWPVMQDYLPVLRAYYPEGAVQHIPIGDAPAASGNLTVFTVTAPQIDSHRQLLARYQPSDGPPVQRMEANLGLDGSAPPPDLRYPVRASWDGAIVAPTYGAYRFQVSGPPGAALTIDGAAVPAGAGGASAPLLLARGMHSIHLAATLGSAATRVAVRWQTSAFPMQPIARRYLWDDHTGRGWFGTVWAQNPADPLGDRQPGAGATVIGRRVDGFLGFRDAGNAFGPPQPLTARWEANLDAPRAGSYTFTLNANGSSELLVDGRVVVSDVGAGPAPRVQSGAVDLTTGRHAIEVRYAWTADLGFLECSWTPPGGSRELLLTPDVSPAGSGVWRSEGQRAA